VHGRPVLEPEPQPATQAPGARNAIVVWHALSISSGVSSTVVFVWTAPLLLTVRQTAAAEDASTPSTSAYTSLLPNPK
jgi:hypothetical protein